ncbi:hypothetical protein [Rhodobacter capsulatus]|uniref:hypothetical protein n=1 Tax=Rhodobacter capsulatus TaxID=1061 RepID=UPI00373FE395
MTRQTAARYLDALSAPEDGFLKKLPSGKRNYYVNTDLVRLFLMASGEDGRV